jgi:hypothetical protein
MGLFQPRKRPHPLPREEGPVNSDARRLTQMIELLQLVQDFSTCLVEIDLSGARFKEFQSGVGPYGEPQLVKAVAEKLNLKSPYAGLAATKRTPDLLIKGHWAVEVKIARPYGDNGREAESWSVNLLHPYAGNVSVIGDCYKLLQYQGNERRAVLVIRYEHTPPQIDLSPLFSSFEAVADRVCGIQLSQRCEQFRSDLRHPVHQQLRVAAWEVLGPARN